MVKNTSDYMKDHLFGFIYLNPPPPVGGGVRPYMGNISMCGPNGYGFSAVLVKNRKSILADFDHCGHK